MKGDAQTIAVLRAQITSDIASEVRLAVVLPSSEARLTSDSAKDVRLAAVSAIGPVAVNKDPESIKLVQASLCD